MTSTNTTHNWPMVPLGELMRKKSSIDPRKSPDQIFELLSIPAFDNGKAELVTGHEVGSSKTVLKPGDVLLSKIVPHIRRAWVVSAGNYPLIGSSEWIVFNDERVHPEYLRSYLTSNAFHGPLMSTVAGVGGSLNRARPDAVARIPIPLPPLDEQRRIAGILDEVSQQIGSCERSITEAKVLKERIYLDYLGKAVEDAPLEDLTIGIFDCPHSTPKWTTEGMICLWTGNLDKGKFKWEKTRYVSPETFTERTKRSSLFPGDIILSREGTVGVAAIVPNGVDYCMGQRLVQVRPDISFVSSEWLLASLLYTLAPERISNFMVGATSKHLNVKELRKLPMPVPTAEALDSFHIKNTAIAELIDKLSHRLQLLTELQKSLSTRAFQGEL